MRRTALYTLCLTLAALVRFAGSADAQPAGGKPIRLVDYLNASSGIVEYQDSIGSVYKFTRDGQVYILPIRAASQIAIQDSDVAWATMGKELFRGDKGWTRWTFVDSNYTHLFVGCANGQLFFNDADTLRSATSAGISLDTGIVFGDRYRALDYLSNKELYILTDQRLYESTDGGHYWVPVYQASGEGLFADRAHRLMYLGAPLRMSRDLGRTWKVIPDTTQFPFIPLRGRVIGSHDCTGTFYVTAAGNIADLFRFSDDGYFHDIGVHTLKPTARVFDGGAIVYGLTTGDSFTGVDGNLSDSAAPQLVVTSDTMDADLCAARRDSLHVRIASRTCLPISIDSVELISATGALGASVTRRRLEGSSTVISIPYIPHASGTDTVKMQLRVHAVEGRGYNEFVPATAIVDVHAAAALLSAPKAIDCGRALIDSTTTRTFVVRNTGCDKLTIDSIVSSQPSLFAVSTVALPHTIANGDSLSVSVMYSPHRSGQDLESIEIGSDGGHRFITLTGEGVERLAVEQSLPDQRPASDPTIVNRTLRIRTERTGIVEVVDLLGITRRAWQLEAGEHSLGLDVLPAGVYILRIPGAQSRRIEIAP